MTTLEPGDEDFGTEKSKGREGKPWEDRVWSQRKKIAKGVSEKSAERDILKAVSHRNRLVVVCFGSPKFGLIINPK